MSKTGRVWCQAYTELVDAFLRDLFTSAVPDHHGIALVAIGGYGRAELAPGSDIDVMLIHGRRGDVESIANDLWYPIWDAGLKLGHSVQTPKQALQLAALDLDTATALLTTRLLAGDERLATHVAGAAQVQWTKKGKHWLNALGDRVDERHATAGEVAFRLEPDLKEGRGGLRDVHSLRWAEMAERVIVRNDHAILDAAYDVLLDARVELQRGTGRNSNLLTLQDQARRS